MSNFLTTNQLIFLNFPIQYFNGHQPVKRISKLNDYYSLMDFHIISNNRIDLSSFSKRERLDISKLLSELNIKQDVMYENAVNISELTRDEIQILLLSEINFTNLIQKKFLFKMYEYLSFFYKLSGNRKFDYIEVEPTDNQIVFLNREIDNFNFSQRLINFFKLNNYKNLSDIIHLDIFKLTKQKNIGQNSIDELTVELKKNDLWLGVPIRQTHRLDFLLQFDSNRYKRIIELIQNSETISFKDIDLENVIKSIPSNNNPSEDDMSRRIIFEDRILGDTTLEEVANKLSITRERVRQLETIVIKKLISKLGFSNLRRCYEDFTGYFNNRDTTISKADFIIKLKCFQGLDLYPNFYNLINKFSLHLYEVDHDIKPILAETINGEIIFYTAIHYEKHRTLRQRNTNLSYIFSYERTQENLNKYFDSFNINQLDKDNLQILGKEKLREFGRNDLIEYLDQFIDNYTIVRLSNRQKIEKFFLEQTNLISTGQAVENLKKILAGKEADNKRSDHALATLLHNTPNIHEFTRGHWGHERNFLIFNSEQLNMLSDVLLTHMKQNTNLQYNSINLCDFLNNHHRKFLDENGFNISDINNYNLNVLLKKSHHFNKNLFYLGRNIWTQDKHQKNRKEIKYLIIKHLSNETLPVSINHIISKIEKERQIGNYTETSFLNYIQTNIKEIKIIYNNNERMLILNSNENSINYEAASIYRGFKKNKTKDKVFLDLKFRLKNYQNIHGNMDIPTGYKDPDGYGLGHAVYRYKSLYNKSKLDSETKDFLNSIEGWNWQYSQRRANLLSSTVEIYQYKVKVEEYIAEFGNHNIPSTYRDQEGYNLGLRTYNIRKLYQKGKLSKNIINILENISGWQWKNDTERKTYDITEICKMIEDQYNKTGRTTIKTNLEVDGIKLARLVNRFRERYKRGTLPYDEIKQLEMIAGWSWYIRKNN